MKPSIIFMIIAIVIVFGADILMGVLRKSYLDKLAGFILDGNFAEFDRMISKKTVSFLLPGFNTDYLYLNRYIGEMNDAKVREYIDLFGTRKLNEAQKKAVYQQGFNYFIIKEDEKYARKCHDELKKLSNMGEQIKDIDTIFGVVIEKKNELLDKLVNETASLEGKERIENEALIAQIYSYLGDEENAEKYLRAALEDRKKMDEAK